MMEGIYPPPRYRWVVFVLLAGAVATRVPVGISLGMLLPDITATFGLSAVQQGWLGSALNLGHVLLGVPAAWLFSRYNPRILLSLSMGAGALLTFAQALAPSYGYLLALRTLAGVVFVSLAPARILLIQQWFPLREVVLVNGMQVGVVGVTEALTFSLTPLLSIAVGGWRNVMHVFGALGMAASATWWALGKERKEQTPRQGQRELGVSPLLVLLNRPVLWLIALGQAGAPAFWWAYATFWPTFMQERYGLPLETSGFLFGLTSLGMVPGSLAVGWLCSRSPSLRRPFMWGCGVALGTTAWGMLLTDSVPWLFVLCLVGGLGWGFVPLMATLPFELPGVQPREVAIAASFLFTAGSLGGLVGPVLAGWLIEQWGGAMPALAVLALLAFGVSASGFALERLHQEEKVAAQE